ncbi:hypothetical protein H4219_001609 [Mycoemilia scoparia]|uniref:SH3 domain-containing protein n=1 Tax=Mycoemilia scoparia TaxID=417184 RepID=A0A9W8DVK6_9FUNG|nr:hypothetical protein H4219_001609 [Mycoemilia scoparia]
MHISFESLKSLTLGAIFLQILANILSVDGSSARRDQDQSQCFTLGSSLTCPEYNGSLVSSKLSSHLFNSSFVELLDTNTFDAKMKEYMALQDHQFKYDLSPDCPIYTRQIRLDNKSPVKVNQPPVVQYLQSVTCALLIAGKDNLGECYGIYDDANSNSGPFEREIRNDFRDLQQKKLLPRDDELVRPPQQPLPLCRETCQTWIDSIYRSLAAKTACQAGYSSRVPLQLDYTYTICDSHPINGKQGMCINGENNEPGTCGMSVETARCHYCPLAQNSSACRDAADVKTRKGLGSQVAESGSESKISTTNINDMATSDSGLESSASELNFGNKSARASIEPRKSTNYATILHIVLLAIVIVGIVLWVTIMFVSYRKGGFGGLFRRMFCCFGPRGDRGGGKGDDMHDFESNVQSVRFLKHHDKGARPFYLTAKIIEECFGDIKAKHPVTTKFTAKKAGEIDLAVGDKVVVDAIFDDGWAVGYNLVKDKRGFFPLTNIIPPGILNEIIAPTDMPANAMYSKGSSSFAIDSVSTSKSAPSKSWPQINMTIKESGVSDILRRVLDEFGSRYEEEKPQHLEEVHSAGSISNPCSSRSTSEKGLVYHSEFDPEPGFESNSQTNVREDYGNNHLRGNYNQNYAESRSCAGETKTDVLHGNNKYVYPEARFQPQYMSSGYATNLNSLSHGNSPIIPRRYCLHISDSDFTVSTTDNENQHPMDHSIYAYTAESTMSLKPSSRVDHKTVIKPPQKAATRDSMDTSFPRVTLTSGSDDMCNAFGAKGVNNIYSQKRDSLRNGGFTYYDPYQPVSSAKHPNKRISKIWAKTQALCDSIMVRHG